MLTAIKDFKTQDYLHNGWIKTNKWSLSSTVKYGRAKNQVNKKWSFIVCFGGSMNTLSRVTEYFKTDIHENWFGKH